MQEYKLGKLNGRFVVSWWVDGKRRRYRLDALTLSDAKAEAIDRVRSETLSEQTGATVADLWEAYRVEKSGRRVTVAMNHEWKAMAETFGALRPDQVTIDLCRAYVKLRRKAKKQDGTIWTELGHLRTVFIWAHKRRLIPFAPAIERPSKPAPRERHLTRAECEKLIASATAHHIRLAIILLLSTAARVGAVLDLTWDRVDLDRGQIRLRNEESTTRKGRATVPINAGLRAALAVAKKAAMTEHVIEWAGQPVQSIKTGFNAAVLAAGVPKISPHDLRRSAAIHMAEAGVSMDEIAQYLGHDDSRITSKVYARYQPEHLRKASDVLDFTVIKQVKTA